MNSNNGPPGRHSARRGDDVDRWLESWRDERAPSEYAYYLLDQVLSDYRLHADTGTPLDAEVADHG